MSKPSKTTAKNFSERVIKFAAHVQENSSKYAYKVFDEMLNTLADEDYFGTEQQCDPRGDQRE